MRTCFSTLTRMLAVTALSLSAPALAQDAPPTAAAPAAQAAPATMTDADPALWVVRDADTTIYLFGTVHLLRPGLSWFDEAVKTAFDASDELKIEVVLPENPAAIAPLFVAAGSYPAGTTLTSRLSPEQLTTYQAGLQRFGIPATALDPYEPWFVSLQLAQGLYMAMGMTPDSGAEKILTTAAAAAGKPITGFETIEDQLGFFDGTPESEQIGGLLMVFERAGEMRGMIDRLLTSWTEGKPDDTAVIMNEGMVDSPETSRILLTDRNRRWADTLKARMDQPGTVFVAVGAGHLAGDNSVQTFLAERGLTVTRVEY
jgi:uncharacterized protein